MNKSTILSAINGFLTAIITQAKVRSSHSTIVDNLWSTIYVDEKLGTSLTPKSATTPLQANIDYNITFSRVGNRVDFIGFIFNSGLTPFPVLTDVFSIDISDLEAKPLTLSTFTAVAPFSGQTALVTFTDKLYLNTSLPVGQYFYFNGTYFTAD